MLGRVQVALFVQRVRDEAAVHGTQRDRALALGDDDAGERHLAGARDRLAQHGIDVLRALAVWRQVVAGIIVDRIDRPSVDELLHLHDLGALDTDAREILVGDDDVLALGDLVAFDRVAPGHVLAGLGILRHHLDPVAGGWVDHVETDRLAVVAGAVERHRTGDEGQPEMPFPDWSLCHALSPNRAQAAHLRTESIVFESFPKLLRNVVAGPKRPLQDRLTINELSLLLSKSSNRHTFVTNH